MGAVSDVVVVRFASDVSDCMDCERCLFRVFEGPGEGESKGGDGFIRAMDGRIQTFSFPLDFDALTFRFKHVQTPAFVLHLLVLVVLLFP